MRRRAAGEAVNHGRCDSCCDESARLVATAEGFLCEDCADWWVRKYREEASNIAHALAVVAAYAHGRREGFHMLVDVAPLHEVPR